MKLKSDKFAETISKKMSIPKEEISNGEYVETLVFNHAKILNPSIAADFEIEGNAHWKIDEKGYLLLIYKNLIGKARFEELAYTLNKNYANIDAHVVVYRLPQGVYYSLRLKLDVMLEKIASFDSTPDQVDLSEDKLKECSLLCYPESYPQYRCYPNNASLEDKGISSRTVAAKPAPIVSKTPLLAERTLSTDKRQYYDTVISDPNVQANNYKKTIELLKDYTKSNSALGAFFGRVIHGAWNRHYLDEVEVIINNSTLKTASAVLAELEKIHIDNKNGALARRIFYIRNFLVSEEEANKDLTPSSRSFL